MLYTFLARSVYIKWTKCHHMLLLCSWAEMGHLKKTGARAVETLDNTMGQMACPPSSTPILVGEGYATSVHQNGTSGCLNVVQCYYLKPLVTLQELQEYLSSTLVSLLYFSHI